MIILSSPRYKLHSTPTLPYLRQFISVSSCPMTNNSSMTYSRNKFHILNSIDLIRKSPEFSTCRGDSSDRVSKTSFTKACYHPDCVLPHLVRDFESSPHRSAASSASLKNCIHESSPCFIWSRSVRVNDLSRLVCLSNTSMVS